MIDFYVTCGNKKGVTLYHMLQCNTMLYDAMPKNVMVYYAEKCKCVMLMIWSHMIRLGAIWYDEKWIASLILMCCDEMWFVVKKCDLLSELKHDLLGWYDYMIKYDGVL